MKDRVIYAFSEWHDDVCRHALSLGLNAWQAEEITQDAFLRLYIALESESTSQTRELGSSVWSIISD